MPIRHMYARLSVCRIGVHVTIAIGRNDDYLLIMATNAHRTTSKTGSSQGTSKIGRSASSGRFLAVASLKPVTKRATITSAQADKAVKEYLDTHKR